MQTCYAIKRRAKTHILPLLSGPHVSMSSNKRRRPTLQVQQSTTQYDRVKLQSNKRTSRFERIVQNAVTPALFPRTFHSARGRVFPEPARSGGQGARVWHLFGVGGGGRKTALVPLMRTSLTFLFCAGQLDRILSPPLVQDRGSLRYDHQVWR